MSDNKFDLRAICREVLAEGGCDTFRGYAEKVLKLIPREHVDDALMACLPDFVRNVDHHPGSVTQLRPGQHASKKVKDIGDGWAAFMARHIATKDGLQIQMALATQEEVRFYAGLLRVKASEVQQRADLFDRIADLMASTKATRVKDIPLQQAATLMRGAA